MPVKFKSEVSLDALNNATTDTDKFLVSDSGIVKYRTGTQLLSDLGVSGLYVPYTGATGNVDLGTHTLSSYDLIVNHTSGSGVAASITKGGNGEALTINKSSGSGNAMSVIGGLTSLVDLALSSIPNATIDTDRFIVSDGGAIKYRTGAEVLSDIGGQPALTNPITGTGTTNYVSKFTGSTSLGNSQIFDNGTNVLIGTTTDGGYKLDVNGGIRTILGYIRGANSNADINLDGSVGSRIRYGGQSVNLDSANVSFRTNSLERMRVNFAGNVLIGGTTDTGEKFQVFGQSNLNSVLIGNFDEVLLSDSKCAIFRTEGNPIGIRPSQAGSLVLQSRSSFDRDIVFVTGATPTERMTIKGTGNVGIGITNPTYKLHVIGEGYFSSNLTANNIYATQICNVSTCNNASFALTSSGARITRNIADSNTAFAVSQNHASSTGAIQTWNNSVGEKMRIASSGNVGIGTTSPTAKLDINGTLNVGSLSSSSDAVISLANNASGGTRNIYYKASNASINITSTGGSDLITFLNGGNVGIGTTSPAGKLSILDGYFNTFFSDTSSQYGSGLILSGDAGSDQRSWRQFVKNGTGGVVMSFEVSTNGTSYGSSPTGLTYSEKMRIDGNGNVGVGTVNPQRKLEVKGSHTTATFRVYYPDENVAGQDASVDIWASEPGISFNGSGIGSNVNGQPYYGRTNPALGQGFIRFIDGTTAFHNSSTDAVYAERMRITPGGSVGIGTSSPAEKFQVNGNIALDTAELNVPKKIKFISNRNTAGTYGDIEWYNFQWDGLIKASIGAETSGALSNGMLVFKTSDGGSNASERMRILGNGNVAIGTTSPGFATAGRTVLTLNGSSTSLMEFQAGGAFKSYFYQSGTSFEIYETSTLTIAVGGSERMRITSGGNVGIGTTAPIHKLSVNGKIGGDVWSAGYIEFLSTTETVISAESNVVLGYAQNVVVDNEGSLGVGTIAPEACAAVEIKSLSQGFLPPRMRTGERDSIGSPVAGLMIFNTDDEVVQVYTNGSGWRTLAFL